MSSAFSDPVVMDADSDKRSDEAAATEADIARWCADAGLPVAEVRCRNEVLVLVPERPDALPEASTLQDLGRRIQQGGYRHVAFSIDPKHF